MKMFVIALSVFLAGVAAAPGDGNQARFIDGVVTRVIGEISQDVRDRGLDPYVREHDTFKYRLPVTDLLVVEAALENFYFEGLSNILINNINFSIFTSRLDYDFELPLLSVRVGSSAASAKFFDRETSAYFSGNLDISGIRLRGRAVVRVSIISGVTINSLTVDFTLRNIKSDFKAIIHEKDVSDKVNWALEEYVPYVLNNAGDDINRLLEHHFKGILGERL